MRTKPRATVVLDMCLAGCAEDVTPELAALATKEVDTHRSQLAEAVALLRADSRRCRNELRGQGPCKPADDDWCLSCRRDSFLSRLDAGKGGAE